ncbi:MAG: hypothetical protein HY814_14640, partial [Candidatus Riflebacteria bacterium]|nr:hypothetical protein [Candidatus Riflebacteria bacterium]
MREKLLEAIVRVVLTMPLAVVAVALALGVLAYPAAQKVELRSSQLDMLPKDDPIVRRWIHFTEDFDV